MVDTQKPRKIKAFKASTIIIQLLTVKITEAGEEGLEPPSTVLETAENQFTNLNFPLF